MYYLRKDAILGVFVVDSPTMNLVSRQDLANEERRESAVAEELERVDEELRQHSRRVDEGLDESNIRDAAEGLSPDFGPSSFVLPPPSKSPLHAPPLPPPPPCNSSLPAAFANNSLTSSLSTPLFRGARATTTAASTPHKQLGHASLSRDDDDVGVVEEHLTAGYGVVHESDLAAAMPKGSVLEDGNSAAEDAARNSIVESGGSPRKKSLGFAQQLKKRSTKKKIGFALEAPHVDAFRLVTS